MVIYWSRVFTQIQKAMEGGGDEIFPSTSLTDTVVMCLPDTFKDLWPSIPQDILLDNLNIYAMIDWISKIYIYLIIYLVIY